MNKRIMLALLLGFGSYSCHAEVSTAIRSDLISALKQGPLEYIEALESLKRYDSAFPYDKKMAIQNTWITWGTNANFNNYDKPITAIFYFILDKDFEEIYVHISVQMKLIQAAWINDSCAWGLAVVDIGNLNFLTEEEQSATIAYIAKIYWEIGSSVSSED